MTLHGYRGDPEACPQKLGLWNWLWVKWVPKNGTLVNRNVD